MRKKTSAHLCHFYLSAIGQPRMLPGSSGALPCQGTRHCNTITHPCRGLCYELARWKVKKFERSKEMHNPFDQYYLLEIDDFLTISHFNITGNIRCDLIF
jgi:hypothetical protein